jgi:Uncharacterized membrane-associated protein
MPSIPIREWIDALGILYQQYGYLIVFFGALSENTALVGLILPGNSLTLLGAFYARDGTLSLGWVIFIAWLGTVLGYHIDYLLGRFALVHIVSRCVTSRPGRRIRLAVRLRLAHMMLTKHGGKAILISHMVGHMRSFVAISAGIMRMKYTRFLCFEAIAALLWTMLFSLLGYTIAGEVETIQTILARSGWLVLAGLLILFIVWRWWKRKKRKRHVQRARRVIPN